MPLFRRPDGTVIKDESETRRMMPFIMRRRNESIIYHQGTYEVASAQKWLKEYNHAAQAAGEQPATFFHLFMWCCARALHDRPGLNRFVSGSHIYQRKGVSISFAAKKALKDGSPLLTVKLGFPAVESFRDYVRRC